MAHRAKVRGTPARRGRSSRIQLLVWIVMLFELTGFVLIALPESVESAAPMDILRAFDTDALALAVLLPLACFLTTIVLAKLFSIDQLLMALTHFLCGVGMLILYSMDPERGMRQAEAYFLGLGVMIAAIFAVRWVRSWKWLCWLMLPVGFALLALPILFGEVTNGAKNWISLPVIGSFQPSEIVKVMLVIVLAQFFSGRHTFTQMLPAILFVGGCLVFLMVQADLGTALMYYFTTLLLYFVASSNLTLTLLGLLGGAGAAVLGYNMFAHVKVRVAMWKNPWSDALGKGYQIIQALMAIGSGGLFGLGLGLGSPRVIPAYHTDFIFAVICEQFGIIFGLCIIGVYIVLILRGIAISVRSRQSFHALLAFGCSVLLGVQTFIIIAGVIKMIPLTGITMPFISYGGTSMVSCMALMGLLQGASVRIRLDTRQDARMAGLKGEAQIA